MTMRVEDVDAAFRAFVGDPRFPCLAGKGVVRTTGYDLGVYDALGSLAATHALSDDLDTFVARSVGDPARLHAFVAVFAGSTCADETEFEDGLWRQLQRLSDMDTRAPWDPMVSDDPDDPRFAFSHAGCAMFIVGMHPASSRRARRFRWPTLVFNPRSQFEALRATHRFDRLRGAVREREIALQGTLNPNLADFGEQSEARQYSGRETGAEWQCPFHRRAP